MIIFRKASVDDISSVMPIIKQAQLFLAQQHIDQWQDGFPNIDTITFDITEQEGYIIENDGEPVGYFATYAPPEPTYENITEGKWLVDTKNYYAMHRLALSQNSRGLGLGHKIYDFCCEHAKELGYDSIRVDTHIDNKLMQHLAASHGFKYCGVVYYPGNIKRIAFEKKL